MNWTPSKFEEAVEEYFERRCAMLEHFTFRYRALSPEYDSEIETAHDYSDLDFQYDESALEFQTDMSDVPENVWEIAETFGYANENFHYRGFVREIQSQITSEAASLKLLKEDYPISENLQESITEALNHVVGIFHKEYHRRVPENEVETHLFGSEAELLVHEGELMPLPEQIEMSYNSIKGEDEVTEKVDSPVTPFIRLEPFFE